MEAKNELSNKRDRYVSKRDAKQSRLWCRTRTEAVIGNPSRSYRQAGAGDTMPHRDIHAPIC